MLILFFAVNIDIIIFIHINLYASRGLLWKTPFLRLKICMRRKNYDSSIQNFIVFKIIDIVFFSPYGIMFNLQLITENSEKSILWEYWAACTTHHAILWLTLEGGTLMLKGLCWMKRLLWDRPYISTLSPKKVITKCCY